MKIKPQTTRRSPPRTGKEHVAAFTLALVLHACVIAWLAIHSVDGSSVHSGQAIQVSFLAPVEPRRMAFPASRQHPPHAAKRAPVRSRSSLGSKQLGNAQPAAPRWTSADDRWPLVGLPAEQDGQRFRPDPLRRNPVMIAPLQDRMHLTFHDTSLGGRINEASRRSACRDLDAALAKASQSADAILASMRDLKCRKG